MSKTLKSGPAGGRLEQSNVQKWRLGGLYGYELMEEGGECPCCVLDDGTTCMGQLHYPDCECIWHCPKCGSGNINITR